MLAPLVAALAAASPSTDEHPDWILRADFDPVVFAIAGFSVAADLTRSDAHWRLQLGAFHARVPEPIVPVVARGPAHLVVDEDCVRVAALYDVDEAHSGLFFGPEVYLYRLRYTAPAVDAIAHEAYLHGTVGVTFFPLPEHFLFKRFFLMPWATVGIPLLHTGTVREDGVTIHDRILNWHATVSLGVVVL